MKEPKCVTEKKIAIKSLTSIRQTYEQDDEESSEQNKQYNLNETIAEEERRLEDLLQQQQEVQSETKNQIDQLRENWSKERLQLVEDAKKDGYEAGFTLGKKEATTHYLDMIDQANRLTDMAEEAYISRIEQSTTSLIELSIEIAAKIMNREIDENEHALQTLVEGAMNEVKDQPEIQIYLPSAHYESILSHKNELAEMMRGKANLTIYISSKNECYITHPLGKIDLSIDTQLAQMRENLLEIAAENNL